MENHPSWDEIERLIQEIAEGQRDKLLSCGRRVIPTLTSEDMLQPNDYMKLEHNPNFRYEEGLLAGIQTVQMALWALKKERD